MPAAAEPRTARPHAADAPAGGQSPPDLGELLRTGATLFGVPVTALRITTADGRTQKLELPEAVAGQWVAGEGADPLLTFDLNDCQQRIVRYFATLTATARVRGNVLSEKVRDDESDSTIRRHLAALVDAQVLNNDRNMDGYGRGPLFAGAVASLVE